MLHLFVFIGKIQEGSTVKEELLGGRTFKKIGKLTFLKSLFHVWFSKYIFLYIDKEPVYKQIALGWQMVKIFH